MGRRIVLGLGLGITGLAGFLLATGALAPVIGSLVPSAAPAPDRLQPVSAWTSQASSDDGWMDQDTRPEWSSERTVPDTSRPSSPSLPSRPAIQVPENPKRFLRGGVPANNFELHLKPRPSCFQQRSPGSEVKNFTVTPGKGSAAVSWWDLGDPDTSSYVLTAVPTGGGRGVVVTRTVEAPKACTTVRTSVGGLLSGQTYRFWLSAVNTSPVNGRQYRPTRGQSNSIVVP